MQSIINNRMASQNGIWSEIIEFVKDNTIEGGIFALLWKTIDVVAKHFAEKRKAEMKELIKDMVNPQIEKLTDSINDLREEIGKIRFKN